MEIDLQVEYRALGIFYDEVATLLDEPDALVFKRNDAVSGWSTAQQLYHILRANGMMFKGIHLICQGHRIADNEGEPNKVGWWILENERFIRGKAKAPDNVVPPDEISREDLQNSLARSRKKYDETEAFLSAIPEATGRIPHTFMGFLNAAEWLRLARVHSQHHLAIIHDIVEQETTA